MTIKSIWLRRVHKWIGLVIGIQFLIWAISGAVMALLDMNAVAGGAKGEPSAVTFSASGRAWPQVQQALSGQSITGLTMSNLPQRQVFVATTSQGVRLFDASDGTPVVIDGTMAASVASAAHPERAPIARVLPLSELNFAVREHALPIWQVDFRDEVNSSYYVSGSTGELLERRNDSWRWWDLFWMLHNMDYAKRTSFNHPLIITVGFAMAWLAATGFWLLFRTMWRHDFTLIRRWIRPAGRQSPPRTG